MNYELAKQLKDAGFPLKCSEYNREDFVFGVAIKDGQQIMYPLLGELIEACGDVQDFTLYRRFNGENYWIACWISRDSGITQIRSEGSTPLEAVANLWLAINRGKRLINRFEGSFDPDKRPYEGLGGDTL